MRLIFYAIKMKLQIPYFRDLLHTMILDNRTVLKNIINFDII